MPRNVGPWFHRVAALLEEDERQSVLGDIAERRADLRALLDLVGLVMLRQLQAWISWRPWLLVTSLALPVAFAASFTHPVAAILYSHRLFSYEPGYWSMGGWVAFTFTDSATFLIQPWKTIGAVSIAWAIGFAVSRLGGPRLASVLPLLVGLSWRQAYRSAPVPVPNPPEDLSVAVAGMALLITVPVIHGFYRGLQHQRLSLKAAAALFILMFLGGGSELFHVPANVGFPLLGLLSLWPVAYVAYTAFSARKRGEGIYAG